MQEQASEEMVAMLHTQCAEAEAAIKDPRFDPKLIHSAWSAWGHTLLQLATVQQTMEHKLEYLSRSREKLQKAISLNDNTIAPDEKFTYFVLGDNNFLSYLFTEEDEDADKFLEEAKKAFGQGLKKDRTRGDCLKILVNCKQNRKEMQDQDKRLKGKNPEERMEEYYKIICEKVESLAGQIETEPGSKDARLLRTYGSSCIDLAMMMEQAQDGSE
ncbi:hypothetical protein T484DRAFT_1800490 [Baffinella frigidus]|nr:hypothetical protein T484DRAFT_1800490 [Cryptophyta sp. CCMP2293]